MTDLDKAKAVVEATRNQAALAHAEERALLRMYAHGADRVLPIADRYEQDIRRALHALEDGDDVEARAVLMEAVGEDPHGSEASSG